MRLVNELFVNEIPELQHGGKLRPVMFISAAWIIGSYNELVRDVTTGNIIVMKVMKAKESANIYDIRVAQSPEPRRNVVLEAWYQQTTDKFRINNPNRVSKNASLSQKTVGLGRELQSFGSNIEGLESRVYSQAEDKSAIELARDNYQVQTANIEHFLKENTRLK